jgi:SOS-response transcriptional repressor LexA
MAPLTARQREWLRAIVRFYVERGRPPTFRELMAMMGTTSPNAVSYTLCVLKGRGLVGTWGPGLAHLIRVPGLKVTVEVDDSVAGVALRAALGEGE